MKYKCPYCKKESQKKDNLHWPFCSERCKIIDLGKWASGGYRIPGEPVQSEQSEHEAEEKDEDDVD